MYMLYYEYKQIQTSHELSCIRISPDIREEASEDQHLQVSPARCTHQRRVAAPGTWWAFHICTRSQQQPSTGAVTAPSSAKQRVPAILLHLDRR